MCLVCVCVCVCVVGDECVVRLVNLGVGEGSEGGCECGMCGCVKCTGYEICDNLGK